MNGELGPERLDRAVERSLLDGHDGRSGARLERVRLADGTRLVVKRSRASADLAMRLSGDREGRELQLWLSGVLDRLPPNVGHAVVAGWREDEDVVVVMRDLGDAVIGWDSPIGRQECRRIFAAAAAVHATFAGQRIAGLCPLRTRLSLFAPSTLSSLPVDDHPLVGAALRGWERFAGVVPADLADAVTAIHAAPGSLADALVARGTTLTHGDLWLVNAALQPDRTVLLDWGLATEAPGAVDFATFLMGASAVNASRDDLVDDVRRIQGTEHDEIALLLALLAAVVDLGWNKALDATEHSDPSIRDRETAELSWWVGMARRALTPACSDNAIRARDAASRLIHTNREGTRQCRSVSSATISNSSFGAGVRSAGSSTIGSSGHNPNCSRWSHRRSHAVVLARVLGRG